MPGIPLRDAAADGKQYGRKDNSWVEIVTAGGANVGGLAEIYSGLSGKNLQFRTLQSSDATIVITQNANDLNFSAQPIQENLDSHTGNTSVHFVDAAADGKQYARKNNTWEEVVAAAEESDPVFLASDAAGITATDISHWDAAYSWGDHATEGYLTDAITQLSSVGSGQSIIHANPTGPTTSISSFLSGDASVSITKLAGGEIDLRATGAGGGESNTGENIGGFVDVYSGMNGTILQFRTLQSSDSSVSLTQNANDINIVASAASVGADPAGSASGVQSNLDSHSGDSTIHFTVATTDSRYFQQSEFIAAGGTAGKPVKTDGSGKLDGSFFNDNETDPVFVASAASGISVGDISNWDAAYSWGDHDGLYDAIGAASTVQSNLTSHAGDSTIHFTVATTDTRYFQKSEFINVSAGAGDAGKPIILAADGKISSSMYDAGSGGSPGGSDGQVQYNDSNSFNGTSYLEVSTNGINATFEEAHFGSEITSAPAGTTQTIELSSQNHQTLDVSSASGDLTVTLNVPSGVSSGSLIVKQGATARNITWASAATIIWLGTEPTWNGDTNKYRIVSWRYDGTRIFLVSTDSN